MLFDLYLRHGTIAKVKSWFISGELSPIIDNHKIQTFFSRLPVPYISEYDDPSIGNVVMIFNPTHRDVCPRFRHHQNRCTDPNCLKIHRKIKNSLFSQVSRLEAFDRDSFVGASASIIRIFKWNNRRHHMECKIIYENLEIKTVHCIRVASCNAGQCEATASNSRLFRVIWNNMEQLDVTMEN